MGVDDDEYPPSKKDCSLARGALGEIRPAEQGHRARGGDRVAKPILSLQGVEVALFCPQIVDYQCEFVGSFILSPRFTSTVHYIFSPGTQPVTSFLGSGHPTTLRKGDVIFGPTTDLRKIDILSRCTAGRKS